MRLPAEWEKQEFIQLVFPHENTDWNDYLEAAVITFINIANHICKYQKCLIVAKNLTYIKTLFTNKKNLSFVKIDSNDTWSRDFGGITVEDNNSLIKFWLDLIVQRFEVTKKIYESYPHNFRNGEGRSNIIQLYWMFALSLILFYCKTKNIKYLSTLLKVSDLLCSLDEKLLSDEIPAQGLSVILLVELLSVKILTRNINGVEIELT